MSCYWNAIMKGLDNNDLKKLNITNNIKNPRAFASFLKDNNRPVENIFVGGIKLSKKEIEEMFNAVKEYDINTTNSGYLCSISDCFLSLICELFDLNIQHTYCGINILYQNRSNKNIKKTIMVSSDKGHMWFNGISNDKKYCALPQEINNEFIYIDNNTKDNKINIINITKKTVTRPSNRGLHNMRFSRFSNFK